MSGGTQFRGQLLSPRVSRRGTRTHPKEAPTGSPLRHRGLETTRTQLLGKPVGIAAAGEAAQLDHPAA